MPRYYFHVIDDLDSPDTEGAELPGLEAARDYGARAALGLMADLLVRERGEVFVQDLQDAAR